MDDAMYDMQTGSQDDGAGHEPVKRKPVRPAELRLDDSKENLGLERVDYGYLSPYLETQETPADRVARVLLQCLFDRFGSVFPQCGLMVFPGVVIVSR